MVLNTCIGGWLEVLMDRMQNYGILIGAHLGVFSEKKCSVEIIVNSVQIIMGSAQLLLS